MGRLGARSASFAPNPPGPYGAVPLRDSDLRTALKGACQCARRKAALITLREAMRPRVGRCVVPKRAP